MNQSPPKHLIYRIVLLLLAVAVHCSDMHAQELGMRRQTTGIAGTSGEYSVAGRSYIIQQSIGQASVIGTSQSGDYSLRQGFIQPEFVLAAVSEHTDLEASLFPNPFGRQFQIRFDAEPEGEIDVEIYDLSGRAILRKRYGAARQIAIDLPQAAAGMYLIHIVAGTKQFSGRIQKLNL